MCPRWSHRCEQVWTGPLPGRLCGWLAQRNAKMLLSLGMLMLSATQIYTIFTVQLFAFLNLLPVEADIAAVSVHTHTHTHTHTDIDMCTHTHIYRHRRVHTDTQTQLQTKETDGQARAETHTCATDHLSTLARPTQIWTHTGWQFVFHCIRG